MNIASLFPSAVFVGSTGHTVYYFGAERDL